MSAKAVQLEIPARPEFVGIARMAVGALAGIRPGLAYERIGNCKRDIWLTSFIDLGCRGRTAETQRARRGRRGNLKPQMNADRRRMGRYPQMMQMNADQTRQKE